MPEVLRVAVPSVVAPSMNLTVPVGVPTSSDDTVAVKVTVCPKLDGLSEEASLMVVAKFVLVLMSTPNTPLAQTLLLAQLFPTTMSGLPSPFTSATAVKLEPVAGSYPPEP